ncbi:MAG TPA: hypothetical protein VFB79_04495, partial [Candidatus Angelobacter sp.]|nr:hypothetical protein [Candidatus Angelobacter sp.]
MALQTQLVDGKQALDAQERALNFMEQAMFAKVINYSKAMQNSNTSTANEAVLQDVPIGQQPKPLHLEALDVNGDATQVINQQLKTGRNVIFHETAFVAGKEQ